MTPIVLVPALILISLYLALINIKLARIATTLEQIERKK